MHDLVRVRNTRRHRNHRCLRRLDGLSDCQTYGVVVNGRTNSSFPYFLVHGVASRDKRTRSHVTDTEHSRFADPFGLLE